MLCETKDAQPTLRWQQGMERQPNTVIFMLEERVFGYLITMGAYMSRVQYSHGGHSHDVYVENDEFQIIEEPFIYEQD